MANRKASYRAALRALDLKALGSVHGGKKDVQPDVTLKLSCHKGNLGPYFQVKLTVAAPASMNFPDNKYSTLSKLYSGSFIGYNHDQITKENLEKVPKEIRQTHRFDETSLGYQDGKPGIVKLIVSYECEDSTHEGLFNNLLFKDYIDPQTGEPVGDKPHVQHAVDSLRNLFSKNGDITFYVRDEEDRFQSGIEILFEAMDVEQTEGTVIDKFYKPSATTSADGSRRTPFLQMNQRLDSKERPQVYTYKTYIHRDFTDFATRKGYAAIQSMEYEKQELHVFNGIPARVKFISIAGGGEQKYLGIFYADPLVGKRLQVGDILWISFAIHIQDMITSAEWKTQIIGPLPWLKSGEVAGIVSRPREPFPYTFTPEQRKVPRDFIKGRLPAGDGLAMKDEQLRDELDKQRYIQVRLRLESSDQTFQRQVNAINILQRAQRLDPNPRPGEKATWQDRPKLRNWQLRLCNKSQLPDDHLDILGNAASFLTHLTAADHRDVIKYLQAVPVLNSIALGIVQGRAGVGKTFVIASVVTAMLRADREKKFLILTPSNAPCDVVARKVWEEMQKYPETKDLIVMRAHNVAAGKNYLIAHAKLVNLKTKLEEDKKKTTEELQAEKARQILINKKKAHDAEIEALKRKEEIAMVDQYMLKSQKKKGSAGAEYILSIDSDDEASEYGDELDPDLVMNQVLPDLIQKFNDEVVVSEGCFRADGSIDVERLERDHTLGQTHAGLRLASHLSKFMSAGDRLISDPRFQEVRQSLAWTILVTVGGLVSHRNAYTDEAKWAHFRIRFKTFMEEGDYMDADERANLDESIKRLSEYCVSISSVLVSTENNIASSVYTLNFPTASPLTVIVDEANRSLLTDACIVIAHFEPEVIIYVGDTKQLQPVVTGPTPLTGFLPELQVSTMAYFEKNYPSVCVYTQRRSRAGIMNIPSKRYYHAKAIDGPDAHSDTIFHYSNKVMNIIHKQLKDRRVQRFPSMYFEIETSEACVDPVTKSRYNLKMAAFVINMVETFVQNDIPPCDQGIVTPYMAQVTVYKYAVNQLNLAYPAKGYNRLLVGTADSMEGEERPVMHVDTTVTREIGFVDKAGRLLVMSSRGKHAIVTYGNTCSLILRDRRNSDLIWMFDTAKSDTYKICHTVPADSKNLYHPFIQNRTIGGEQKHTEELAVADKSAAVDNQDGGWENENVTSRAVVDNTESGNWAGDSTDASLNKDIEMNDASSEQYH